MTTSMIHKSILPLIFILASILTACTNENQQLDNGRRISDYKQFGDFHNQMLDNLDVTLFPKETKSTVEYDSIAWQPILISQKQQIMESPDFNVTEKFNLCSHLEEYQKYYVGDILFDELFPNSSSETIVGNVEYLYQQGIIDAFERNIVYRLIDCTYQQWSGVITATQFTNKIKGLQFRWEDYYSHVSTGGHYSGYILGIAIASCEWWDEADLPETRMPVIIANDLAGALIGATGNLIWQTGSIIAGHTKNIDYYSLGGHALIGAVTGSTGLVGKIGKVFTKK